MVKHLLTTLLLLTACVPYLSAKRTYTVEVGTFSRLNVPDNISVIYRCNPDSIGKACFECEDQFADAFLFTNPKSETLKIQISPDFIDRSNLLPVVYVYSEFLTHVESASEKRVQIEHPARQASFKGVLIGNGTLDINGLDCDKATAVLASGNGTVIVSGRCLDSVLKLTGTGRVDALELDTDNVTCQTFGTGDITCRFTDSLTQRGLGSTTIHYKGDPSKVKKKGIAKFNHLTD